MSKVLKFSIAGAWVLALAVFFVVSNPAVPVAASSEPSGSDAMSPGSIYATHCAACHGSNGRAQTPRGKKVDATDLTGDWNRDMDRTIRIITNGHGDMPAFHRKLSDADIRSVAQYVHRFHR